MNGLQVGQPMTLDGITLIPIGLIQVTGHEQRDQYWFHGTLDPLAVVIQGAGGASAWDIGGGDLALEDLIAAVPDLARVLEAGSS